MIYSSTRGCRGNLSLKESAMSRCLRWPALLLAMVSLSAAQAAPLYKVSKLSGATQNIDVQGLNNLGQAVGTANGYSYIWSADGTTQLHKDFSARAINNHGVVAGTMHNLPDDYHGLTHHAYTYFAGTYKKASADTTVSIGSKTYGSAINDSGVVTGALFDGHAYHPARFQQQNQYFDMQAPLMHTAPLPEAMKRRCTPN